MSYRTNVSEIQQIMGTLNFDVGPFLNTAHIFVENYLVGQGLSDSLLAEIEKYLAAHFVCLRNPQIIEEAISDGSAKYMRKIQGGGLLSTDYGQTAIQLDTTGILNNSMKSIADVYIPDILTEDY